MSRRTFRSHGLLPRLRAAIGTGVDLLLFLLLAPAVLILARRDAASLPRPTGALPQTPLEGARHRA